MSIPKVIYQTQTDAKIPLYAKWQIWRLRRKYKHYKYVLYTEEMMDGFIKNNFNSHVYDLYSKLQIQTAKTDFFRYAILYFNGGIYLNLDSAISTNLDRLINNTDNAIISKEKEGQYAQWALIFERQHPILKKTINLILNNISNREYPHNIINATGSKPYSLAINEYLQENHNNKNLKIIDDNYNGVFVYKTTLAKISAVFNKKKDWRYVQKTISIYKDA